MSTHGHSGGAGHHHVAPISAYVGTFLGLLVLTAVTVGVTWFDMGSFNIVVALGIAVVKAALVVLFFMGLRWDHDRFNAVVFGSALLFLSLFFVLTFPDLLYRDWLDPVKGNACTNPEAYCPTKPAGAPSEHANQAGHASPEHTKRVYFASDSTGAASRSSGVIVNESGAENLPGGALYGKPAPSAPAGH